MKRVLFVVVLALAFFAAGCKDSLLVPVVTVNTTEKVLQITNETLFELESRQLADAINASPDAATARAKRDEIVVKWHRAWVAYDKARASWTIARIATAEAEVLEKSGAKPNLAALERVVADAAADETELKNLLKEIAK